MKKLVFIFIIGLMLSFAGSFVGKVNAQDLAADDSLSIDDMDPVFYHPDDEEESEGGMSSGLYIGIAVLVVVVGGVGYKFMSKKK